MCKGTTVCAHKQEFTTIFLYFQMILDGCQSNWYISSRQDIYIKPTDRDSGNIHIPLFYFTTSPLFCWYKIAPLQSRFAKIIRWYRVTHWRSQVQKHPHSAFLFGWRNNCGLEDINSQRMHLRPNPTAEDNSMQNMKLPAGAEQIIFCNYISKFAFLKTAL